MATVLNVQMRTFGNGYLAGDHAVVETEQGNYKYSLEFQEGTWIDREDYMDNATSDFENEDSIGNGIDDTELFYKLEDGES